ncbi:MAG: hypothetical protein ACF8GE_02165 [Phycisphaerales bacterium JB043]
MIGGVLESDAVMEFGGASTRVESSLGGFEAALGRWSDRAQGGGVMSEEDARGAAQELVAMTFVQPILSQMREMNNAAPPFAPGVGERRFGAMWDAEIAQRLVRSEGFGLVDAVARDVLSKARRVAPAIGPALGSEFSSDEQTSASGIDTTI